ncbi:MAG: hypothetical protein K1X85_03775 [Ignavibacteria bacterium]|nr:hypothetical protein [Ignavibacteria bacterium]
MNISEKTALLKKLIRDMKGAGHDALLNDLILLSAIAEMKMSGKHTNGLDELETKIDDAIKILNSINQLKS